MEENNYKNIDAGNDKYGEDRLNLGIYLRDNILNKLGKIWFIENGTLLGAYRTGKFIKHDDDFDIGLLIDSEDEINEVYEYIKMHLDSKYKLRLVTSYCKKIEVYDESAGNYILKGPQYNGHNFHYITVDIQFYVKKRRKSEYKTIIYRPPLFTLLVTLNFISFEYLEKFKRDIKPLCDYIGENEPSTISYEILHSENDPLKIILLERYIDKENAYKKVHRSSKLFKEFREKLKIMEDGGQVEVSGDSFIEEGEKVDTDVNSEIDKYSNIYERLYFISPSKLLLDIKYIYPTSYILLENEYFNAPYDIEYFLKNNYGSIEIDAKYNSKTGLYEK